MNRRKMSLLLGLLVVVACGKASSEEKNPVQEGLALHDHRGRRGRAGPADPPLRRR